MLRLAVLVLCLVACGGSQHAAGAHLALAPIEVYEGDEVVIQLLADGELQVLAKGAQNETRYEEWVTVGKIDADGKIASSDGRTVRLDPDGTIPGSNMQITSGALVTPRGQVTIDARGAVLLDGKPFGRDKVVRVEGVTDATRRTALLVLALTVGR